MSILVSYKEDGISRYTTLQKFLWDANLSCIISKVNKLTDFRKKNIRVVSKDYKISTIKGKSEYFGVSYTETNNTYRVRLQHKGFSCTVNCIKSERDASIVNNYIRRTILKSSTRLNNTGLTLNQEDKIAVNVLKRHPIHSYTVDRKVI